MALNNSQYDEIFRSYDAKHAYAYFALFQTIALGYENVLVFNPRSNEDDVKVFILILVILHGVGIYAIRYTA